MTIQQQFEKFHQNIRLTLAQDEDAQKKYNGVCKCLHAHYYPEREYSGKTKLLIGSYGKHTNIRPPRDVDVIFIMPPDTFTDYNKSSGQSQLLQDIREVLKETYSTTEKIRAWGKVIQITFSESTHNIELLPSWEQTNGTFLIPNTKKGGHWENWDPRQEIKKISDSELATKGKTRTLIRMTKKWTETCTANLTSFQIEKGVVDFYNGYDSNNKGLSVLTRDFFNYFKGHVFESTSHLETAFNRATKACDFEEEGEIEKATEEWKKIFGSDFPSTENKAIGKVDESTPALGNYSHCEPLKWPFNDLYNVDIDAFVYSENKAIKMGGLNSDGRNLAKKLSLKFTAKTNTSGNSEIYWQVVNTGEEARLADGLRGGIFHGERIRWESTLYKGKHWIECYVIQNNMCIARSRRYYINIR